MTSHYYVTGTSRGLGRALAETLAADPDAHVTGIGRSAGPSLAGYTHAGLDLNDLDAVAAFRFPPHAAPDRVVLINNAGVIAPAYLQDETADSIRRSYAVNIVAPLLLINTFLAAYGDSGAELVVCNVSSRAGSIPMAGSVLYGGTKSALDISSRSLVLEAKALNAKLAVLCVDPGSIDTAMQETLRSADENAFAFVPMMRQAKAEGRLQSPDDVAARLVRVLKDPSLAPDVCFTLADLPV